VNPGCGSTCPQKDRLTDRVFQEATIEGGVTLMLSNDSVPTLTQLSEAQRAQAMLRFAVLRPHLEDGISLSRAAVAAGVAIRTAGRWLARYRVAGLVGLARAPRTDVGQRKLAAAIIEAIEGI
jgi:putative transposase